MLLFSAAAHLLLLLLMPFDIFHLLLEEVLVFSFIFGLFFGGCRFSGGEFGFHEVIRNIRYSRRVLVDDTRRFF